MFWCKMNAACGLYLATVLFGSFGNPRTIFSTGEYETTSFRWAVGISNLEFYYSGSGTTKYNWFYEGAGALVDEFSCDVADTNSTFELNISCIIGSYNSTLYILSTLQLGNSSISVTEGSELAYENVTILYCENLNPEQPKGLKIVNGTYAEFETMATYQCNTSATHSLRVNGIYTKSDAYQSRCLYNASWSKMDQVECHYVPKIISKATQSSFVDKDIVNFTCDADDGYPNTTILTNFIGNESIAKIRRLVPDDHGKPFHCEASNTYTDHINSPSKSPDPYYTLIVYFAPILEASSENGTYVNQSGEVYFYFRANNQSGDIKTSFLKRNAGNEIDGSCNNVSDTFYNCSYTITINNSSEDYGEYVFTASTVDPAGNINVTIDITDSPPVVQPPATGPNIALIAGVCGGAALLIVILVVLLLVRRRRNKDTSGESAKEERENPLYGTAPAHPGKEEKSNPLYSSSGIQEGGIEEAYGVVDGKTKKKNADKGGNSNSAFTSDGAEVTYAAVNKPKKKSSAEPQEAVYSAVNKKKAKKGSNEENGLHGKPTIDGN